MKTPTMFVLAGVSAAVAVGFFAQAPGARMADERPAACAAEREEIPASALSGSVDARACQADGRPIVDGAAGATLPSRGKGVHVEVLTADGAEELEIRHLPDGTLELDHVGDEAGGADVPGAGSSGNAAGSGSPGQCGDTAYRGSGYRVVEGLRYRINWKTIPGEVSRRSAVSAVRRAGANVARTDNECGMGDRVSAFAAYAGRTSRFPDRRDGSCRRDDGLSVVAFGDLPSALAVTCNYLDIEPGPDEVVSSDVKMNKADFRWTTRPDARSCRTRFDVEAVMTHERGHSFGLDHVDGETHHNLTMAPGVAPCQATERSLGRGDVLGLDAKYP